jgi:hypothetical protein
MNKFINPSSIEAKFHVTLPKRYKDFLEKGENEKYDGWFGEIPSYEGLTQVFFTGKDLESFINDEWPDDDSYGHPSATMNIFEDDLGYVPLATIGKEEEQFLVADASEGKCPVFMWEHETGEFEPVSDSLDKFLKSLKKRKA